MNKRRVSKEVYDFMQNKLKTKLAEKVLLDAEVLMLQIALDNCEAETEYEATVAALTRNKGWVKTK